MNAPLPAPGTIGLTSIAGEVGALVHFGQWLQTQPVKRWLSDNDEPAWEHAFVLLHEDGTIIEAAPGGARISNVAKYGDNVYWCNAIARDFAEANTGKSVILAAGSLENTPYSFLADWARILHRLKFWAPGLKGYIGSKGHLDCGYLADWAYHKAGYEIFSGRWPGYVTPMALYFADKGLHSYYLATGK